MAEANTQGQEQTPGRMAVARRRKTRSDVWEHYSRFTADDGSDKAECKHCHLVLSANTRNGTSTLRTHIKICNSQQAAAAVPLGAAAAQPPLPSASEPAGGGGGAAAAAARGGGGEASRDLARMIALHGHDPSIVEDEYFRSFVRRLNPEYKAPSRHDIEEMCDAIFDEARMGLFSKMPRDARVCLAVGKAKTVEGELLYTACHFIDDAWSLQKLILDAMVVVPFLRYYGPLLGFHAVTLSCAADFIGNHISDHGILDKLFMMSHGLKDEVVQARLKDWIEENLLHGTSPVSRKLACTTYVDDVLHSIARCFLLDQDFTIEMSSRVQDLNLTRQERQQILSELGLHGLWAYKEHWYSCYCSLELLADDADSFAQLLRKLWGEIYRAIRKISASSCPTSNLCLGELFKLREILQSELALAIGDHRGVYDEYNGFAYGRDVADVLKEASDTLDMAIQDSYLVWSIPLALDPRYKLRYIDFIFKRAFASDAAGNYISEVTRKTKELYTDYVEDGVVVMVDGNGSVDPLEQAWGDHLRREAKTELDRYLEDSVVSSTQDFDILNWWKDNSWNYPTVARMARDALAIPTCSKLCHEQIAQVRSMVRGYSKDEYSHFS